MSGLLKVVFLPDFNVKNSHRVYPAADLSEQISTAGKEASGTGNMKFAMNGALTIGTLDGANVEIRDAVGAENFFLFGLTADEVDTAARGRLHAARHLRLERRAARDARSDWRRILLRRRSPTLFRPLVDSLLTRDDYLLLADYQAYVDCQQRVSDAYRDRTDWTRMSILNTARVGRFSSDRVDPRLLPRHLAHRADADGEERAMSSSAVARAKPRVVEAGASAPLGASVRPDGVNFSVFSKDATLIELLLFDEPAATEPVADHSARCEGGTAPITTGMPSCRGSRRARSMPTARTGRSRRSAGAGSMPRRCCSIRTASRSRCPMRTTARPRASRAATWPTR